MTAASLPPLECGDRVRRAAIARHPSLHGIDYVEVATEPAAQNQRLLHVYFIPKSTPEGAASLMTLVHALAREVDKVRLTGGVRVLDVRITHVDAVGDHLDVHVDQPGDFSRYTLGIVSPKEILPGDRPAGAPAGFEGKAAIDPAFAEVDFSFKAGCPSRFDCAARPSGAPEADPEPVIDYMAKDYASFRQALLDFAAERVPEWFERHEADLGVALVELMAYAGDQLSYHQDAVANEAYLETARKRLSVRRHARLIDYGMHDGASARALVHVAVAPRRRRLKPHEPAPPGWEDERHPEGQVLPAGTVVLSRVDQPPSRGGEQFPWVIAAGEQAELAIARAETVFQTAADAHLHHRLNEIHIHPWGNRDCRLAAGSTRADLRGDLTRPKPRNGGASWALRAGDFLLFEEVRDPDSGRQAEADPSRRQVVRLTEVVTAHDPLLPEYVLTRVSWDPADALRFPLSLKTFTDPKGGERLPASVARGNLVPAEHGRTVVESGRRADRRTVRTRSRGARLKLAEGPLAYRLPEAGAGMAFSEITATDPRQAAPGVDRASVSSGGVASDWEAAGSDLLDAGQFDQSFAVEVDDDGRAILRFGDGELGTELPDDAEVDVTYRVGLGSLGNVGPDALQHVIAPSAGGESGRLGLPPSTPPWSTITRVRNPIAAWGGAEPEDIEQVRRLAPAAFRAGRMFAVTEDDYARAAEQHREVSRAVATFRWTGSWLTVFVTVDPRGRAELTPELETSVRDHVARFAQAGYDLEIDGPTPVPLDVAVDVCASPAHFRSDVEAALIAALGTASAPTGERGFFHPDRFTFGQPLYLSELYAAIEAVPGVEFATVRRFQRYAKAPAGELESGVVEVGRLDVVRLDNDPSRPENGLLELRVRGGK